MGAVDGIRRHSKLIIVLFILVSLGFIVEEFVVFFFKKEQKEKDFVDGDILVIDSERIKYNKLKRKFDSNMDYYRNSFGISENNSFWVKYIWNNLLNETIENVSLKNISKNLGLKVGDEEAIDLFQGEYMDEDVKRSFKKKEDLLTVLNKMSRDSNSKKIWINYEREICDKRNQDKVKAIIKNISNFNNVICEREFTREKSKLYIEYLFIPYPIIRDDECTVDDKNMKQYLHDHKNEYKKDETYTVKYFVEKYKLSEDDKKNNINNLLDIKKRFSSCKNSVDFAKSKSDNTHNHKHKDSEDKNLLKCLRNELPEVIKNAEDIKENDTFIEIAETIDELNKIYKVIKIENNDKKEKIIYNIAVIFKKPIINWFNKTKLFNKIQKQLSSIYKEADFEELARERNIKIKKKKAKLDENNFEDVDDSRQLMHYIMKNFKHYKNGRVFVIEPFSTKAGCFCGIVTKHDEKGTMDFEEVKEDLKMKCTIDAKCKKIFQKLKDENILDMSFDEIKNKKFDFIKFGEEKDIDFKVKKLKEYGYTKDGISNIELLNEGEDTGFFKDDNGVLRVKLIKITKTTKEDNEYNTFYETKNKEKDDSKNIIKLLEQRFNVENNKDYWL